MRFYFKHPGRPFLFPLFLFSILAPALPASALITARFAHSSTLLPNGNIITIGGLTGPGAVVTAANSIEIFVSTANFSYQAGTGAGCTPTMLQRSSHTATVLPNGNVLVAGGGNPAALNDGWEYNPNANSCAAAGGNLGGGRINHTASLLQNGKVLIAGGDNGAGASLNATAIYTPGGAFILGPTLTTARAGHTATVLYNGLVYVAGGYNYALINPSLDTTELYDPNAGPTGAWIPGPPLTQGRFFHTATAMGNRSVLIAGGLNGKNVQENRGFLSSVEVYNPVANSMTTPPPPMNERRMLHAAELTADGNVLIEDGLGNITTSYQAGPASFGTPSSLVLATGGACNPGACEQGTIQLASNLTVPFQAALSVPAFGVIQTGAVYFSSASASLQDADVLFANNNAFPPVPPPTQNASLNGASVGCDATGCGKINQTLALQPPSGIVNFHDQTVTAKNVPILAGGSQIPFNGPCQVGSACTLDPTSALTITVQGLQVPFPLSDVGGSVLQGNAVITAGSIIETVGSKQFTISLTGGQAAGAGNFSGGPAIALNGAGTGGVYTKDVTFSGFAGTISYSTAPTNNVNSPQAVNGLQVTGLNLTLQYTVSPVNLAAATFNFDVATITIQTMLFGDQEIYNPLKNSWSLNTAHDAPRFNEAMVLSPNGDSNVLGGLVCNGAACGSLAATPAHVTYIPSRAGQNWNADAALKTARANHTSTVLPNGKVLTAGGVNGPATLSSAELYDPSLKAFAPTGSLTLGRSNHTATLLTNGTVLIAGGFISGASTGPTSAAEIYYPDSGAFLPTGIMVSSRDAHTATLLPDGTVLVTGGRGPNGAYLNTAEIYDSVLGTWRAVANMPVPTCGPASGRSDHTATLMQNGQVLIAGGINGCGPMLDVAAYDSNIGGWAAVPPLSMPAGAFPGGAGRFGHAATLLRDGRVLVTGGDDGFGEIGAAIIYNPATNSWLQSASAQLPGDMLTPRLRHTATLLPDGKVMVTGGVTSQGASIGAAEGFDVDRGTWQSQGLLANSRGYHTTVLLGNGRLLDIGGTDVPNHPIAASDSLYYGVDRDANTPGGSLRQPAIVSVDTAGVNLGGSITFLGNNFRGAGEASGGGSAGQNSSFHAPRIYLQALAGMSGFLEDITPSVYNNANPNQWANMDSSITVQLPASANLLPFGWYQVREAANAEFSDAVRVRVGPPPPSSAPGVPSGTQLSPSTVLWSWTPAAGGGFNGYHVYNASNNVQLSTLGAACGASCQFTQTGIQPGDTVALKVAAFDISGDGPAAISTISIVNPLLNVNAPTPLAVSQSTIIWSWNSIPTVVSYQVFSASAGVALGVVASPTFTELGLSTNTANGVYVIANNGVKNGPLSPITTAYTLAVPPAQGNPLFSILPDGDFQVSWSANSNPPGTQFNIKVDTAAAGGTDVLNAKTTLTAAELPPQPPNTPLFAFVSAINGDGASTGFTTLGSTVTLAKPPTNPVVTNTSPSEIDIAWSANGNPPYTAYQVTASSDNFATSSLTAIPFSANFTGTSASLTNLQTDKTYLIRIVAQNLSGTQTSPALISTAPNNGGAPVNNVAFFVPAGQGALFNGTVGSDRQITVQVPPGSFDSDVTLTISSQSNIPACGPINAAVSITPSPYVQPHFPVLVSVTFSPSEPGITNTGQLALVRFDPASGTCIPLKTSVDAANGIAYATINHFSSFQLQQVAPAGDLTSKRVFPNPLYTRSQSYMTFDRLPANARVRIYTLHGEEVFDEQANGSGLLLWPGWNKVHRPVGSGMYIAVIDSNGRRDTMKLAVIR